MRCIVLLAVALAAHASTALLDGKKIHYTASGAGKETLIFIHGWGGDETFFAAQVKEFSAGYRVITLDLPGHGQSDTITPFSMNGFARAVEAVRAAEKIQAPILIGHSLGATVAREHVRLHPKSARALVFLDGSIFQLPPDDSGKERWSEMIGTLAKSFGPANEKSVRERNISAFLATLYSEDSSRDFRMEVLKKVLTTKAETAEGAMRSMADLSLWREDSIALPVLALRAGQRPPPGEEIYLRQLFPRIQYKFMPGVSHFLMLEKPLEVDAEIKAFLKGLKP